MKTLIYIFGLFSVSIIATVAYQEFEVRKVERNTHKVCNEMLIGLEEKSIIELLKNKSLNNLVKYKSDDNTDIIIIIFSGKTFYHGRCTLNLKNNKVINVKTDFFG